MTGVLEKGPRHRSTPAIVPDEEQEALAAGEALEDPCRLLKSERVLKLNPILARGSAGRSEAGPKGLMTYARTSSYLLFGRTCQRFQILSWASSSRRVACEPISKPQPSVALS